MKRLFVDCDDTLVLWLNEDGQPLEGQNPYGGGSDRWEPNTALIEAIRVRMKADPELRLIIWTGGGNEYGRTWAERLMPGEWDMAGAKDPRLPLPEDLCIDDAEIVFPCQRQTWQEFVSEARP